MQNYLKHIYHHELSIRCCRWSREVKQLDFDDRVDILPVADPNIFSMAQRIYIAQTELQLATSNPKIHNLYASVQKNV